MAQEGYVPHPPRSNVRCLTTPTPESFICCSREQLREDLRLEFRSFATEILRPDLVEFSHWLVQAVSDIQMVGGMSEDSQAEVTPGGHGHGGSGGGQRELQWRSNESQKLGGSSNGPGSPNTAATGPALPSFHLPGALESDKLSGTQQHPEGLPNNNLASPSSRRSSLRLGTAPASCQASGSYNENPNTLSGLSSLVAGWKSGAVSLPSNSRQHSISSLFTACPVSAIQNAKKEKDEDVSNEALLDGSTFERRLRRAYVRTKADRLRRIPGRAAAWLAPASIRRRPVNNPTLSITDVAVVAPAGSGAAQPAHDLNTRLDEVCPTEGRQSEHFLTPAGHMMSSPREHQAELDLGDNLGKQQSVLSSRLSVNSKLSRVSGDSHFERFIHRKGTQFSSHRLSAKNKRNTELVASSPDATTWAGFAPITSEEFHRSVFIKTLIKVVDSLAFDYASGVLIILNALLIGIQTDYAIRNNTNSLPWICRLLEVFFCVVFSAELALRIFVYRSDFCSMQGYQWNIFECVLVVMQIFEEAINILMSSSGDATMDMSVMRIARVMRLIRIVRVVRVLRLISELRTIVISIMGSMRSLFWTLALLLLLMYAFGVYFTQLVADQQLTEKEGFQYESDNLETLLSFFGSLARSMFTLFSSITGGISWEHVTDPMISEISLWAGFVFTVYIAFSMFALMNIVTGVFVESALQNAKTDKDLTLLQQLRKLFELADVDCSGKLTLEEFENTMENPVMLDLFEAVDLDIEEAKELYRLIDIKQAGSIEAEDFVNGCFQLRGPAKALDLATLIESSTQMNRRWQRHASKTDKALSRLLDILERSWART